MLALPTDPTTPPGRRAEIVHSVPVPRHPAQPTHNQAPRRVTMIRTDTARSVTDRRSHAVGHATATGCWHSVPMGDVDRRPLDVDRMRRALDGRHADIRDRVRRELPRHAALLTDAPDLAREDY